MAQYTDLFPTLALSTALLFAALAAAPMFERLWLPGPAAFLVVGIVAGLLGIAPTRDLPTVRLEQIGAVGLFLILFQGGLATGFRAARAARPILTLGLLGTAAAPGGAAVLGRYGLGLGWSMALLVGVALAPTDPAAVYAVAAVLAAVRRSARSGNGQSHVTSDRRTALPGHPCTRCTAHTYVLTPFPVRPLYALRCVSPIRPPTSAEVASPC